LARIAGVDLPRDKRIETALTYLDGIGLSSSRKIIGKSGVNPDTRVRDMSPDDIAKIRDIIANEYKVEGALRSEIQMNIKRLIDIGCYRGLRHRRNLPCRGQRTHTNARTRRGRRGGASLRKKNKPTAQA
jgi:small subunit ribosomal protein S13